MDYDSFRVKIYNEKNKENIKLLDQSLFVAFDGTFEAVLNNEKKPIMINSNQYYKNALVGYPAYSSITPVINRAIITMIKQRVDENTIIAVTGHGEKIYKNCVELLKKENPNFNILDENYLNDKIKKTPMYKLM